jgi:hypothetical protein
MVGLGCGQCRSRALARAGSLLLLLLVSRHWGTECASTPLLIVEGQNGRGIKRQTLTLVNYA